MGNWKWFSGKSHVQTGEERRVQRVADVWREVVRVVFCFNFVLKLFLWKDLAAIAALIFLLVSFFPFSWPMFEWWDVTPLALFLSHFTVLGSSYVSLFPSLIFVMMFKKKQNQNSLMAPHGLKNVWRIMSFSLHNAWISAILWVHCLHDL